MLAYLGLTVACLKHRNGMMSTDRGQCETFFYFFFSVIIGGTQPKMMMTMVGMLNFMWQEWTG